MKNAYLSPDAHVEGWMTLQEEIFLLRMSEADAYNIRSAGIIVN
jgi:hypothetical protein